MQNINKQVVMIKEKHKSKYLAKTCEKLCVVGLSNPHLPKITSTLYIPSSIRNMFAFGTYNTNLSCEPELSKYRHIS